MSRLTKIENDLKSIEGGRFQNLCNELLFSLGYGKVTKSGGHIGTDKTIKGTPDAFILLPNGKFVEIEYTVQQDNVYKKFSKDIDKCCDESKTGLPEKDIEKIIICYNTIMTQEELKSLKNKCESKGITFEHFDISVIAQYINNKYPQIAKDYFGIEFNSGQVITFTDFVKPQRNVIFSTPLDNQFMFREDEMSSSIQKLENNDILVIHGKAGVGKTRLSLEIMKKFIAKYPDYKIYCLSSNGEDIFSDLNIYFSNSDSYLLLIDDANRFEKLSSIINLIQKPNIKLILTVRDYALNEININLQNFKHDELKIDSMSDENIRKIIMFESIGIKNELFLDRICTISNGNPRLAIMASTVAKETDDIDSLRDVSKIYNNYFSAILHRVTKENSDLIQVLGILCYFQNLERGSSIYNQIAQYFNFTDLKFWNIIRRLYELEVVDLYNQEVVKITDQVLATYLCYYTLIERSTLDFEMLLDGFFFDYKHKMIDAIFPMLNTFDYEKVVNKIKPYIDKIWYENKRINDVIDVFWFVKPFETLLIIKNRIDLLPYHNGDLKFEFPENKNYNTITDFNLITLKKLTNFDEYNTMSIELVFLYLEKKPDIFLQVMELIKESIFYDLQSYYYDYKKQKEFIIFIVNKTESSVYYKNLLFNISFDFLKTHHSDVSQKLFREREVRFCNFNIILTNGMKELRRILFDGLSKIICNYSITEFINRYIESMAYSIDKKILMYDFEFIIGFFKEKFNSVDYIKCFAMNRYLDFLEFYDIEDDRFGELRQHYSNNILTISRLLYNEYDKRQLIIEEKYNYQQLQTVREQNITNYFKNYDINEYYKLYESLKTILENVQDYNSYEYHNGLGYILKDLIKKDINMYLQFIEHIVKYNNEIKIRYPMTKIIADIHPEQYSRQLEIIENYLFEYKNEWILSFFEYLPDDQIDKNYIDKFKSVFYNLPSNSFVQLDPLERYYKYDNSIYYDILSSLSKRVDDTKYNFRLTLIYNITDILQKINNDYELLKKLYLYSCKNEGSFDYSGETMQQLLIFDSGFILEYLEWLKGKNQKDYLSSHNSDKDFRFIWKMDNYEEIIDKVIEFFSDEDEKSMVRLNSNWHYINKFFGVDKKKEKKYLKKMISKNCLNKNIVQLIFIPISNIYFSEALEFVEVLLRYTSDIETFKVLDFNRSGRVTSNMEKDIEDCKRLWESLLQLTNSLEFIEIRKYICAKIEAYRSNLEGERRRKYIDERFL